MAGIQTSITLKDGVSPALRKMTAALANLENVLNSVDAKFKNAYDSKSLRAARNEVAAMVQLTEKQAARVGVLNEKLKGSELQRVAIGEQIAKLKKEEANATNRVTDLLARQRVAMQGAFLTDARTVQLKSKLQGIESAIAAEMAEQEPNARKIEKMTQQRNIWAEQIAYNEAKIAQADRVTLKLEEQIAAITNGDMSKQSTINQLLQKQNTMLAQERAMRAEINGIHLKAVSDQAKEADRQANLVRQALADVQKVEDANLKAAAAKTAADTKTFNKAMEQNRTLITQAERREQREAAASQKKLQKLQQEAQAQIAVYQTQERYSKAVTKVTEKYNQAQAAVRKLEASVDRTNAAEMQQLKNAQAVAAERHKILNATQRLVQIKAQLNSLSAQGITSGMRVLRLNHQENAVKRQIANSSRNILRVQRQIAPAINQNAKAQQRFNSYVRGGLSESNRFLQSLRNALGMYVGYQSMGGIIQTADALTTTKARLDLVNDGMQTTEQLQQKIYESAMNTRSGYAETADVVAKLATRAGKVFGSNDETIAFANTLQKMFHIAGASTQEMYSASLQLTQALGSGVLRGEELNAVFEAAPNVIEAIANYMNMPIGKIRDLAKDGEISADIVKNALFAAAEDVNKKFAQMPVTWAQAWTIFKNFALKIFTPLLQAISAITSSDRFIGFVDTISKVMAKLAKGITKVFNKISDVAAYIYDNWKTLKPAIMGVVGAITAFITMLTIAKTIGAAYNIMCGVMTARKLIMQKATWGQVVAQTSLNSALLACPWFWVAAGIAVLIGVIASCMLATYDWENSNIDVVATLKNIFSNLGKFLKDTLLKAWEKIKEIGVQVRDVLASVGNTIVNNWSWIAPIVYGIVGAFVAYKLAALAVSIWTAIVTGVMIAFKAVMFIATFVMGLFTGATWAAMSPLMIFAVIVGLIIFLVYAIVAAINHFCGTSISATGIICAAFMWLFTSIRNMFTMLWNIVAIFVEFFVNVWSEPMYSVKALFVNLATNILDCLISMTKGCDEFATSFANAILWAVNKAIEAWNAFVDILPDSITSFLGIGKGSAVKARVSITSDLQKVKSGLQALVADKPKGYWEAPKLEYGSATQAAKDGYNFGEGIDNAVKNFSMDDVTGKLGDVGKKVGDLANGLIKTKNPATDNAQSDPAKALTGGYDNPAGKDYGKKIAGNTDDIAKNTGATADNTDTQSDDFKYLRQMAERDSMNRSQLMNFDVNMSNVNHVNSGVDVNTIFRKIARELYHEVACKMDGV